MRLGAILLIGLLGWPIAAQALKLLRGERKSLWADTDPIPPWKWAKGIHLVMPN